MDDNDPTSEHRAESPEGLDNHTLPYPSIDVASRATTFYTRLPNGEFGDVTWSFPVAKSLRYQEGSTHVIDQTAIEEWQEGLDAVPTAAAIAASCSTIPIVSGRTVPTDPDSEVLVTPGRAVPTISNGNVPVTSAGAGGNTRETWTNDQSRYILDRRMHHLDPATGRIDWDAIEAEYRARFPNSDRNAHNIRKKAGDLDKHFRKPVTGPTGTRRRWGFAVSADIP